MDIEIIDTPDTCTVADIKPGQEFMFAECRFLRTQPIGMNGVITCIYMTDNPGMPLNLALTEIVTLCDPPAPVTCMFGELKQGDLYIDNSEDAICIRTDEKRGVRLRDGLHFTNYPLDTEVTPLTQVEPLKVRRK